MISLNMRKILIKNQYVIVNDWESGKINSNNEHMLDFSLECGVQIHASNYMNYFGYLDFQIKKEYRSENKLNEIVNQFNS